MKKTPFLNETIYQLHHLIKTKRTGTPAQLAQKLNCSESTIYNKIKILRDRGFPIQYCNVRNCYFYDGDVSVDFVVTINGEQAQKIIGGSTINSSAFFSDTPKKSEW